MYTFGEMPYNYETRLYKTRGSPSDVNVYQARYYKDSSINQEILPNFTTFNELFSAVSLVEIKDKP